VLNQVDEGSRKIFSFFTLSVIADSGEPKCYEEALQMEAMAE